MASTPPPPVVNQAVPRTTPNTRRVTRYGLVHNEWGVGRHCGRSTGIALFLCKRRCKNARAGTEKKKKTPPPKTRSEKKNHHRKPEENPQKKKNKNTRTPERKQPLGRRNRPETETPPGFRAKRKHGKSQKENAGRTGLDDELEEEERVVPRDRGHQPQGQKKIPSPPGTAGKFFAQHLKKVETEKKKNQIIKILVFSCVASKSS